MLMNFSKTSMNFTKFCKIAINFPKFSKTIPKANSNFYHTLTKSSK